MIESVANSGIYTVDALYYQPQLASIHLIRSKDRIAIVDTGTQHSVPQVKKALAELGLSTDSVDLIILTHIHLDHAGGASALMKLCPNAQLVVHERGARHMADPAKLIAGTTAVYGEAEFERLYGTIEPIDEQRIIVPKDAETLDWAERPLTFIDTPGHANHHHCIFDKHTQSFFTGDTLGVAYQALRSEEETFVMPTTTPVQFNPVAMHQSVDRVMSFEPTRLYLTHYGGITPTPNMISGLHEQIDDYVMLTEQAAESSDRMLETLTESLLEYLIRRCLNQLPDIDEATAKKWIALDSNLNAQGLVFWHQHRREK